MGTMQTWRKAYGALKDSTKVGLAKINSEFKDLDVAIVKATNHVECPPKERHVRKIFAATSSVRPRADVAYCIHALARRLAKTRNWTVALKTLIVIHRTLREGDPTFREELLNYSHRGHILQISNFKDDSSPLAWDCSAWVRTYALFLEERLECFRVLKYDIEAERLVKSPQSATKGHSRTRQLPCDDLLEQLPALQQLLFRLIGCQPEGAAYGNYLIQYALALVLKESFKIYCAINDGIINLVDMFFEMSRHDAIKAFNIYKKAGQQAESLSEFYEFCKGLELARNFQFPNLRQPPPSFLTTMEEYIKEAPRIGSVSNKTLDRRIYKKHASEIAVSGASCIRYPSTCERHILRSYWEYKETPLLTYKQEEPSVEDSKEPPPEPKPEEKPQEIEEPQPTEEAASQPLPATRDLLGLDEINPVAAELDESNALALAIIPNGDSSKPSLAAGLENGVSGWELALVTAPSSNDSHVTESKLAGGFDRLLLDSLYDDSARRQQNVGGYGTGMAAGPNPFDSRDPFAMSSGIAPPTDVQMAIMAQQQQQYHQQQMTMMVPYQPQYSQPPQYAQPMMGSTNPFGDPFVSFPQAAPAHGAPNFL